MKLPNSCSVVQTGDCGGLQAATAEDEVRLQGGQGRSCLRNLGLYCQVKCVTIERDEKVGNNKLEII